jgi:hypothetical protein
MPTNSYDGPLPLELDEITPDLLNTALADRFPDARINGVSIEESHHGFSTVLRLHITADPASHAAGLPKSLMLKGQFEQATKERGREFTYKSLEMEYHAYSILPGLGLNMPEVFFMRIAPEQSQMMLLMEDLALRGVHFQNGLNPNTPEQVYRRLTAMAEFHSKTWASPELEEGGKYRFLPGNGATMFVDYMDHAGFDLAEWEKYTSWPRGQACPRKLLDYDWMRRILLYAGELSDAEPNCLIHGDTHLGNLYEDADGTPGFFDSLTRREHGLLEATYHICNALDPIDRRKHDRDMIAHYRNELIRFGVKVRPLADMMHQYATYLSVNLVTFLVNHPTYQSESFNTTHSVRAAIAMMDNNSYDVV